MRCVPCYLVTLFLLFTCTQSGLAVPSMEERPYVWSSQNTLLPQAHELLQVIETVNQEGLNPAYYQAKAIHQAIDTKKWALADQLLTHAFDQIARDFAYGRFTLALTESSWPQKENAFDTKVFLAEAVKENQVSAKLKALLPQHADYQDLKRALLYYQNLEKKGGWQPVSGLYILSLHAHNEGVAQLKARFITTGELSFNHLKDALDFDVALEKAVITFQQQNGLEADGKVGPKTLEALNQTASQKIALIRLNLDRWRWLPRELGDRYILVNIAAGSLRYVEGGKTQLMMKVIVGRKTRKTPLFYSAVTGVVINPYWNVPSTIARKDIIKELRKNIRYIEKKHLQVFSRNYGEGRLNPYAINWFSEALHVYFQQPAGPFNVLGRVKFNMDNPYDIYLHDTSSRELFGQYDYALSSGCIRLEKPLELLQALLAHESEEIQTQAQAYLKEDTVQHWLPFKNKTPVYLMYTTVLPLPGQPPVFCQDIYEKDPDFLEYMRIQEK